MKKKWLVVCLLFSCLLCNCGKRKGEMNSLTSVVTVNDFRITLTAEKTVYMEEEVKEENPFLYKLEMEYIGEERVTLWYGGSLGTFDVQGSVGVPDLRAETDELRRLYMEKDERITVAEWTGEIYPEGRELDSGGYTVRGFVSFQAGEDYEDKESLEKIKCSLSLPLVIQ